MKGEIQWVLLLNKKNYFFKKVSINVLCHQLKLVVSGLIMIGLGMWIAEAYGVVKI